MSNYDPLGSSNPNQGTPRTDLAGNPLPNQAPQGAPSSSQAPQGAPSSSQAPYGAPPPAQTPYGAPPRTDLAGNPLPDQPAPASPYGAPPSGYGAPSQPYGAPGQQPYGAPGAWPPPPGAQSPYGAYAQQNTSGMNSMVPPEIARFTWNWGAFLLGVFWAIANKVQPYGWILLACALLGWIPFVGALLTLVTLGVQIYLGTQGHRLAWQNRRFEGGVSEFIAVQTAWMKWGVGLTIVSILLSLISAAILFPIFSRARERARMKSGYYNTNPYPGGLGAGSGAGGYGSPSDSGGSQ